MTNKKEIEQLYKELEYKIKDSITKTKLDIINYNRDLLINYELHDKQI